MDRKTFIKYKYELIRQINQYRNSHGVRSLKSDLQMDKEAQLLAEQLSGGVSRYRTESPNETIYQSDTKISPEDLAKTLYNENAWYDYQNEYPKPSNFTRMVWKNSELIGFGMQKDSRYQYIFVIKYFPIGNKNGEFQNNVFPYRTKYSEAYLKKGNDNQKRTSYSYSSRNQNRDNDNQKRSSYSRNNQNVQSDKTNFSNFCIEALNAHNYYRRIHHVGPLVLNRKLCRIAEIYSRNLAYSIGALHHSENTYEGKKLGENLYSCTGKEATGEMATKSWYDEIKDYDYSGFFSSDTGHFTQVVWKATKEVGFGKTIDKNGKSYVVANYFPCGNTFGTFDVNVLRP